LTDFVETRGGENLERVNY
jgi:hypothetical protein